MADYTYEIAWWPAPEAVKKDLNAYKPAVDVITKYTPHPVFIGLSVEKQDKFCMFVTWENTAAHGAFIAHPDRPALLQNHPSIFPSNSLSDATVYHTHLNADPLPIIQTPVVEQTILTPRDGVSLDELKDTLFRAEEVLKGMSDVCLGLVLGTIEEKPELLVVLVGWTSVEAHQAYIAAEGAQEADEIRAKIKEFAMFYVSYTRQT
ncbi:unnamed protein product [Peniophora sp. CBMAI 1063]|nr:unnamed protein product [Peniophora sp. CBMAI 1063]